MTTAAERRVVVGCVGLDGGGLKALLDEMAASKLDLGVVDVQSTDDPTTLKAVDGLATVVCALGQLESTVGFLKSRQPLVPLLIVAPTYDPGGIQRAYDSGYLGCRGLFRARLFRDPEERGQFAQALKEALRSHSDARPSTKRIGWKIDRLAGTGDLISLLIDVRMRTFVQQLGFMVERIRTELGQPPLPEDELFGVFQKLGEAMREPPRTGRSARTSSQDRLEGYFGAVACPPAVLVEGESGTGKSLVASWVARQLGVGPPVRLPLVNVNEKLLEAELFGTLPGAFTDAVARPGVLHRAWGRVVFLDEIGDAPPAVQAKLLVYLDTQSFRPDGWPFQKDVHSPVYIVAATNKDLRRGLREGWFREDLYYRFRHRLRLPALRERVSDIRVLVDFVLQDDSINRKRPDGTRDVTEITVRVLERLQSYAFPGNFRELQDVLSAAVFRAVTAGRRTIELADLDLLSS